MYPESLRLLIEEFERLPGIGKKSAVRLAFHVMNMDESKARRFSQAIINAREKVHRSVTEASYALLRAQRTLLQWKKPTSMTECITAFTA
jgi:Holliday junction resolvasome RuvABC DNA-binding subunit